MAKDDFVDLEGEDEGPKTDSLMTGVVVVTTLGLLVGLFLILRLHEMHYPGEGWMG